MPVSTVGDLSMHWDSAGQGEPVVMINGIGADRSGWGMQVPDLAERYRVITFDNRDVGQTGRGAHPAQYGMRQFADDTVGLLDQIGIDRAHIVGASMGGAIAQEFAINYPERCRSATLVCTWGRTDPWLHELMSQWDAIFATQGWEAWARTTWLWVFTHRYFEDPNHLQALHQSATATKFPQTAAMNLRQSTAFKSHDALKRLGSLDLPVHVICGEEDIYTPLRYSIDLANAITGATLSTISEVGHGMFWEATDLFNALVLRFLDNVSDE